MIGDRRAESRGPNLADVRATTDRLCELLAPYRDAQAHLAELLEQLRAELCELEDGE